LVPYIQLIKQEEKILLNQVIKLAIVRIKIMNIQKTGQSLDIASKPITYHFYKNLG